jgi:hypothetical protein
MFRDFQQKDADDHLVLSKDARGPMQQWLLSHACRQPIDTAAATHNNNEATDADAG